MKRGEFYSIAGSGDFAGKPRPGLIVQTDLFNPYHHSFTVCPVSSHLTGDYIYRILIRADEANGLKWDSEIEVDKMQSVWRRRVGRFIGTISDEALAEVDIAMRRWLEI